MSISLVYLGSAQILVFNSICVVVQASVATSDMTAVECDSVLESVNEDSVLLK